jgi:hypothetical protein
MANLIITVISIALVAVAALSAAYYGGTAFMDGQTKAQANTVIAQGKQIAASWTMYAIDHGGEYTFPTCDVNNPETNVANYLVPKYLSSLPKPPAIGTSGAFPWDARGLSLDTPCGSTTEAYIVLYVGGGDETEDKICKSINAMANISDPTAFDTSTMPKTFGCIYISDFDSTYVTYKVR